MGGVAEEVLAAVAGEAANAAGIDAEQVTALLATPDPACATQRRRAMRLAGVPPVPAGMRPAQAVGEAAEVLIEHRPGARRRTGAHHTPAAVTAAVVHLALDERGDRSPTPSIPSWEPSRVIDPAVGGGAFLLAAADALVDRGMVPTQVLGRLAGSDLDPIAVGASRVAVALWAASRGASAEAIAGQARGLVERIRVADGTALQASSFDEAGPGGALPGPWLVVTNPPFLSPLAADTAPGPERRAWLRRRFGAALSAQTDVAALFWLAAVEAAPVTSRVALVLPESIVAAAHAGEVRRAVDERARLTAAWWPGEPVFPDAEVRVCVPVLEVRGPPTPRPPGAGPGPTDAPDRDTVTELWHGHPPERAGSVDLGAARPGRRLADAATAITGVPAVDAALERGDRLGVRARLGAGFRDQFYGLIPAVVEAAGSDDTRPRLVTAGAIDPFSCTWGDRPLRFAGQAWQRPIVDPGVLAAADEDLAAWVSSWLVPKLVVATQTRVIEACVDEIGNLVPSVPTVAVVPADPDELWRIAAWVGGPVASAVLARRAAGTGMGPGTLRVSASALRDLPAPADERAWDRAADALAATASGRGDGPGTDAVTFGGMMAVAHGLASDDPVVGWWAGRLPSWPGTQLG